MKNAFNTLKMFKIGRGKESRFSQFVILWYQVRLEVIYYITCITCNENGIKLYFTVLYKTIII